MLGQVEREMNTRPGCCHSHLRAKWKSRPYLEGQSRRDDLKVAQDVSPGETNASASSPGGTAESFDGFQPSLRDYSIYPCLPRTDVLGYFQVVPSGLDIKAG